MATPLHLYAGNKLVHSAIADQIGRVRMALLLDVKYRIVIPHKGTLDVVLLPQKSLRIERTTLSLQRKPSN